MHIHAKNEGSGKSIYVKNDKCKKYIPEMSLASICILIVSTII